MLKYFILLAVVLIIRPVWAGAEEVDPPLPGDAVSVERSDEVFREPEKSGGTASKHKNNELRSPEIIENTIYIPKDDGHGYPLFRDSDFAFPKDPNAAMVFSLMVPGSGHLYTGNHYRAAALAGLFGFSLYHAYDNMRLVNIKGSDQREIKGDVTIGTVAVSVTLLIYFYSAQDAYSKAKKYNRESGFKFLMEASDDRIDCQLSLAY